MMVENPKAKRDLRKVDLFMRCPLFTNLS